MQQTALQRIMSSISVPPLPQQGAELSKLARFRCFLYLLEIAPQPCSAAEALELINSKINEIEDLYSGIAKNPNPSLTPDGRMYPIQADNILERRTGAIKASTRGNNINIEPTGWFQIVDRVSKEAIFTKE